MEGVNSVVQRERRLACFCLPFQPLTGSSRKTWSQIDPNGLNSFKMISNEPNWTQVVSNEPNWTQVVPNVSNGPKWSEWSQAVIMVLNGPKWSQMVLNCPKVSQSGLKWSQKAQNGPDDSKMHKWTLFDCLTVWQCNNCLTDSGLKHSFSAKKRSPNDPGVSNIGSVHTSFILL